MIEVTDEMLDSFDRACDAAIEDDSFHSKDDREIRLRAGLAAALAIVERDLRAVIVAAIEAALATEKADPDVSSGEAIWQQIGHCYGLAAAADIARGAP